MFWDIIRCSVGVGMRAGALFGSGYFPLFLLGAQLWALIQRQPAPAHNITELLTGIISAAVYGSLLGAVFGMVFGVLNGLGFAVLAVLFPDTLAAAKPRIAAAVCAAVNLTAMFSFQYLLFATDLFTNLSASPHSRANPVHMITLLSDTPTFVFFVAGPALVAAGAAFWAGERLIKWYQDEASLPQPASNLDSPGSLDSLWPL